MYTREKAHLTMHSLAVYFEQNSLHGSYLVRKIIKTEGKTRNH